MIGTTAKFDTLVTATDYQYGHTVLQMADTIVVELSSTLN